MSEDIDKEIEKDVDKISKNLLRKFKKLKSESNRIDRIQEKEWMDIIDHRNSTDFVKYDKPVVFVVVTPKTEEEYKQSSEYRNLETIMYLNTFFEGGSIVTAVSVEIVSENTRGLSEVYNRFIKEEYSDYYVCFIHDDVTINDVNVFGKLQSAHREAEVVGLAGATKVEVPFDLKKPTAWHILSTIQDQNTGVTQRYQSGYVSHTNDGEYWSTSFGKTPQICRLIDGLFMSFDVSKCLKYNFSFDERFTFHHYDLSACLIAAKCGLTITTWPIDVLHNSLGDFKNEAWLQSHKKFVEVYKDFTL